MATISYIGIILALICAQASCWWLGGNKKKCSDLEEFCAIFAAQGECVKNPAVMKKNCCASCKKQDGGGTDTDESSEDSCVDDNANCASWAKHQHCTINPGYMLKHCCLSCKATDKKPPTLATTTTERPDNNNTGTGDCVDKEEYCGFWADNGKCFEDESMKVKCCKSCKEHE